MTTDRPATSTTRKTAAKKAAATPDAGDDQDTTAAHISADQMRHLHALLRDHGITGDKAVHDYLGVALGRDVESRKDLTTVEAAHLIADLEAAEVAKTAGAGSLADLRAPFPAEAIGKLPRSTCRACSENARKRCEQHGWVTNCPECRGSHSAATMHIDYVGHADVTARLLAVDPLWTWEPAHVDPNTGGPLADRNGDLWIRLTVLGVTRYGVGDGKNAKEKIGDALRNAAMRFGVALDLWAKGDREWAAAEKSGTDQHPDTQPPREGTAPEPYYGPSTPELLAMIDAHAERAGVTYEAITAKWRKEHGDLSLDALEGLDPRALLPLEQSIAKYLLEHPPAAAPALTGDRDE